MPLKKTFSRTGATKANNPTSRRLARRGPSCVCLFRQPPWQTEEHWEGRKLWIEWEGTRVGEEEEEVGLNHEIEDWWRTTSQMVCLSYSQKLCSLQTWVKQYLKIILSICCNLLGILKRWNAPHRNTRVNEKLAGTCRDASLSLITIYNTILRILIWGLSSSWCSKKAWTDLFFLNSLQNACTKLKRV